MCSFSLFFVLLHTAHSTLLVGISNFPLALGWVAPPFRKKKYYMPRKRCLNLSIISARLGHAGVWWIFIMQALQRHLLLSLLLLPLLLLFPLLTSQNFGQTNEKWISCLCLCLAYVECSTRLGWAPLHTVCVCNKADKSKAWINITHTSCCATLWDARGKYLHLQCSWQHNQMLHKCVKNAYYA